VSSDDKIRLRELPPVAPIEWPERLSQTLAQWLDKCPRAGYLYVKQGGGMATQEMDRGSLYHAGAARLMADSVLGNEQLRAGTDEAVSMWTATTLDAVAREHPEFVLSHEQWDVARSCLYHTALGLDVEPASVTGIEQKFLLELPESGWNVSGIIDLCAEPDVGEGEVHDYKTQLYVPSATEWSPFQTKLYATALAFGYPVEARPCSDCAPGAVVEVAGDPAVVAPDGCPTCGGRGRVEVPLDPIGGHLTRVRGRELYPRRIMGGRDGTPWRLPSNEQTWTRLELQEFLHDLDRNGERLNERLLSWDFPARSDPSWCPRCPSENECPIPRRFRRFAGHIQTREEAEEAWAWAQRVKEKVAQTEREVKKFAADWEVTIRQGDVEWAHEPTATRSLKTGADRKAAWPELQARIDLAVETGETFKLEEEGLLLTKRGNAFKKRPVGADAPASGVETRKGDGPAGERDWGDTPF
jgi:hypothetical protein